MSLLLEGGVDTRDHEIETLHDRIEQLNSELEIARLEARNAKRDAAKAVAVIKQQLTPLYRGMQLLFGEMDNLPDAETSQQGSVNPKWDSWKKRMPGRPAEFIDLLLVHESMSVKQFMAAAHCGKDAVYQVMSKLGQAGIVQNNAGRYSLKQG